MREYLKDTKFLSMLDEMRIKKHYARLTILTFIDEKPIREIQGIATAGSCTVNGQAALRRTISLTVSNVENENDITNVENLISLNKKVRVEIGLENPFEEYKQYGDIIWFPLGLYVITQATTSTTASSSNISISGKDKMSLLDGTCGGTLPAAVTFHETQYEDENGDIRVENVPIFTIIKECVTHFGKEPEQNIIINDVDMTAKLSIKYTGQNPIWFSKDYKSFVISETAPKNEDFLQYKFIYGQDVGYQETDFTYPGELVFSAGDTVVNVLDKIIETLGNYEYFYDLDGHFIFQQKQNYLNYYYTPITQVNDNFYIKAFSDSKYYYSFIDAKDAISYYNSPKYENIKNDFIIWGDKTDANGITKTIQYHLAIDEKPQIDLANQYMWDIQDGTGKHCYYLFEYERSNYDNVPEPKPIEITYNNSYQNVIQTEIKNNITTYINDNILNSYSFDTEDKFIIYFKVSFIDQVQYYKVVLLNKKIDSLTYLEDYTDNIKFTHLALGCFPRTPEEDDKFNGYYLIEQQFIDNKQVLGYYNSNGKWTTVYTIEKENIQIDDFKEIINKIKSKNYVKIIQDLNFEEDGFQFISQVNNVSSLNTNILNYKLSQFNNKKVEKIYQYEPKEKDELIEQLFELYKIHKDDLLSDLDMIYNYSTIENLKVLSSVQANQIKELKDNNITLEQLTEKIQNRYNLNTIDFNKLASIVKEKVITYMPEEPELDYGDNFYFTLIGSPCEEWREELFRQALLNNENGSQKGNYDDELLAKINGSYLWREQLFNPLNETWHEEWKNQVDNNEKDTWQGWNPAIYIDPSLITYWLDFIDTDQLISKYSVNQIGRRTFSQTKTNLSLLYKLEPPDIIFFENTNEAELNQKIEQYQLEGQAYCALKPAQMKLFSSSGTGSTAFDYIRDALYQYLVYNLTVTINCVPRYYLEPNNLIYIDDKQSKIRGDFVITQYTLPLTYNGNMSITANEALTRV